MPERRATDGPRRPRAGRATGHAYPPAGRSSGTGGSAVARGRSRREARGRGACRTRRAPRGRRSNRGGPARPASALCPEVAVLVGRAWAGGRATESPREREEGAFERQRRDVLGLHGAKGTDQPADGAGGDATPAAELDARQLLAPEEAPDRTLRNAELSCGFGRCQPSGRHRVDPYQPCQTRSSILATRVTTMIAASPRVGRNESPLERRNRSRDPRRRTTCAVSSRPHVTDRELWNGPRRLPGPSG